METKGDLEMPPKFLNLPIFLVALQVSPQVFSRYVTEGQVQFCMQRSKDRERSSPCCCCGLGCSRLRPLSSLRNAVVDHPFRRIEICHHEACCSCVPYGFGCRLRPISKWWYVLMIHDDCPLWFVQVTSP